MIILKTAEANVLKDNVTIKKDMLKTIKSELDLTDQAGSSSADKLLTYLWIKTIQAQSAGNLKLIMDEPSQI